MGVVTIKLPDVGEGIAEAELVEWNVEVGEFVREDQVLAAVMTDKATVEVPSPADGTVVWLGGEIGQKLAIGSDFVRMEVEGAGVVSDANLAEAEADAQPASPKVATQDQPPVSVTVSAANPAPKPTPADNRTSAAAGAPEQSRVHPVGSSPLAAPSVRDRARANGIDLRLVRGTGPAGRITHDDLEAYLAGSAPVTASAETVDQVRDIKVLGLRRKIAERMSLAKQRIPHITIVEEIDVTELESLRQQLNSDRLEDRPKLTVLPFIMAAMARAIREQPGMNALFDDENDVIREHSGVHIGIATQTKAGLMVPVVRHCEARTIWEQATELTRVAEAARSGKASRDELTGSTISLTSLGPLGAIATTPIINYPEVAIVGVNRMEIRPKWNGAEFVPRKMMNISSSFDHRVIDGWDAAVFVKRLKTLLETPALIFVEK
tara:strand:- start:42721 stop:44028 length:1308 start_codon:yes stop_codon:yes gene_type:complete